MFLATKPAFRNAAIYVFPAVLLNITALLNGVSLWRFHYTEREC